MTSARPSTYSAVQKDKNTRGSGWQLHSQVEVGSARLESNERVCDASQRRVGVDVHLILRRHERVERSRDARERVVVIDVEVAACWGGVVCAMQIDAVSNTV